MKLVFRIIFCVILTAMLSTCSTNENVDDSNWKETYATLYRYSTVSRASVNMVFYRVDGKRYAVNGHFDPNGKAIGDKYLIKYNPDNPEQIKEYTWNVGFLTTEKTEETIGVIESIDSKYINFGRTKVIWIGFTYVVNGKKHKRTQHLHPDYKEKYPNLSEGQKYKVLYWDKNPQRAVLYLDKPIKENNEH